MAVQVLEACLEAQQRGAQWDGELHAQRVAAALEHRVGHRLELEHDVARDLPRLLLALVLEDDVLAVGHALLDGGGECLLFALALLLGLDHNLLLHDHPRTRSPVHHLLLLWARTALPAARRMHLLLAVFADDASLDGGRLFVAHVQVLQRNRQLDLHVAAALALPTAAAATKEHVKGRAALLLRLQALPRRRNSRVIVQHTLLRVGEDLVRLRDLAELLYRLLASTGLVRVVHDGQLAIGRLDLLRRGLRLDP
mmetsp:Transcript_2235/g.4352  ORF Transcript_2235/g.4352 Transcript_2235/m.4352 type:complete len:254 (+) Transcript_2235:424-1185(+)